MTGPNLWGIFGRKAGSKAGFTYSDDLKNAGWTWDADRIDKWITNPRAVLPGTKMTFIGMPDPNDRRDVIAFLKVQTSAAPKSSQVGPRPLPSSRCPRSGSDEALACPHVEPGRCEEPTGVLADISRCTLRPSGHLLPHGEPDRVPVAS